MDRSFNEAVAACFDQAADLLSQQGANAFRVRAYRRGAETVRHLETDLREVLERGGEKALVALPSIGKGMASAIREMAKAGRWNRLERLRGETDPTAVLMTIPGIGPRLAGLLHENFHVDTLEELEAAAHDGRLESIAGVGERRLRAIRASIAAALGSRLPRPQHRNGGPSVDMILDVDAEYRRRAAADDLPRIASRRFNPDGRAWLPVLHTDRAGWHFTALYSNTARAHELGRTNDWVVLYFYDDEHAEGQHTVVTETTGALTGNRVVRGREAECRRYYGEHANRE